MTSLVLQGNLSLFPPCSETTSVRAGLVVFAVEPTGVTPCCSDVILNTLYLLMALTINGSALCREVAKYSSVGEMDL